MHAYRGSGKSEFYNAERIFVLQYCLTNVWHIFNSTYYVNTDTVNKYATVDV